MEKLFHELQNLLTSGIDAVLVTIVASSGSTPRGSGARMIVSARGRVYGTVGGGAVEYKCEQTALEVLLCKGSRNESFRLYRNQVEDLGMVCGGNVDVFFHYIPADDQAVLALIANSVHIFESYEPSWLITEITEGQNGVLAVYGKKTGLLGAPVPADIINSLTSRPKQYHHEGRTFYCEKLLQPGRVYIFGGGHIAQQLVPILSRADFRCTVIEDRPEFADPELFMGLAKTRIVPMEKIEELIPDITEDDYICIMTRGHKNDLDVQHAMLKTPACYIGVIGSRHKTAAVSARLAELGCDEKDLLRITTPIGLAIDAETPAEIAISIAAQLVSVRSRHINGG